MSSSDTIDSTSPAFAPLTKDSHGPLIIVSAYIFLIISLLSVVVKLWTRYQTTKKLIWNDWAMFAAAIFAIAQTIALTIAVKHGLGKHIGIISDPNLRQVSEAYYASNILLIAALTGAKISVTLLIISIKPAQSVLYSCYATLAFIGVWSLASILALAFQCNLPTPWTLGPDQCVDQYALQIGIGATNILSDLAIVILPFFMMRAVQVANQKRWIVVALFALRIATPAFTVLSLITLHTYYKSDPQDRTWHAVAPAIWTQAMLNTSIMTACIPSIKRFLTDIQSGLMAAGISEYYEHTHTGGKSGYATATYAKGTSLGSKLASRLGVSSSSKSPSNSALRSRGDKDGRGKYDVDLEDIRRDTKQPREATESVKGLTDDVIMHTIDYRVEYEDNTEPSDGERSSRGNEADHPQAGLSYVSARR